MRRTYGIIILAILGMFTVAEGRQHCKVSVKKYEMKCANISSYFLPAELILQFNADFHDLSVDITKLEILHSNISVIQWISFKHTRELTQLIVAHSHIKEIEEGTFKTLKNLKWLDLSYNDIRRLPVDSFSGIPLKHLKLEGNTNFEVPTNGPIFNATKFTWFNLKKCGIEHLAGSSFQLMPLLSHLDLSYNSLAMLPSEIFVPLQNLIYLDISYNNFQTLNFEIFKLMPAYPQYPKNLVLSGNRWNCDCKLAELIKWSIEYVNKGFWSKSYGTSRLRQATYCESPHQYQNISWTTLRPLIINC